MSVGFPSSMLETFCLSLRLPCPPACGAHPPFTGQGPRLATNQPISLHSCWLSLEGGLLYAFVGPAAAVVLVWTPWYQAQAWDRLFQSPSPWVGQCPQSPDLPSGCRGAEARLGQPPRVPLSKACLISRGPALYRPGLHTLAERGVSGWVGRWTQGRPGPGASEPGLGLLCPLRGLGQRSPLSLGP